MKKLFISLSLISVMLLMCLTGCGHNEHRDLNNGAEKDIFAMDTIMRITVYGDNGQEAIDAAEELINKLDKMLSTGNESSEISQLNAVGNAEVSDTVAELTKASLAVYGEYGGVFNPLVYPLMKAWGFADKNFRVPEKNEIEDLLELTHIKDMKFDEAKQVITFNKPEMAIDFGGIAKGYTSNAVMNLLKDMGVECGVLALGGNIQTIGSKPDDTPWKVAIQHPDGEPVFLGMLEVGEKAIITSGAYERNFEEEGKLYHHILDPRTGYPAESGLISVTVISDNGMLADSLSTDFYVLGLEETSELWRAHSDEFDVVLMTEDREIYISEGIKDIFKSDLPTHIIPFNE